MSRATAAGGRGDLLRDGRFARFWAGHAVSACGDQVSALALPLVAVVALNATPAQTGYLTAALWAPNLVSFLVGTWVDQRRDRQRLLVVADLVRTCAMLLVPLAFATHVLSLPVVYAACVLLGAGGVLYGTSSQSFFVRLVAPDQFMTANSLLSTTLAAAGLVGPAIAGLLVQRVGAPNALLVDAASFAFCAVCVLSIRRRPGLEESSRSEASAGFAARMRDGLTYLRRHWYLRTSLAASTSLNVGAFMIQAVLILYAHRHLHMEAGAIGLALGIGAAGGLLGATVTRAVSNRIGPGVATALGAGLSTAPMALVLLARSPAGGLGLLAAAEFVCAWAIMLFDINNNSMRAQVTADGMRARVAGAYSTINYGSRPIGALLGGWLATALGTPATIAVGAAISLLAPAWILLSPIRRIRRIDALEPVEPSPRGAGDAAAGR